MARVLEYKILVTLFVLLNLAFLISARPLNILNTAACPDDNSNVFNHFSLGSILDAGPSPGIGHGVEDKAIVGGIKAGPSPGIGHGYALGGIKDGPSPGIGHKFVNAPTLGELKKSGPSPGAGHYFISLKTHENMLNDGGGDLVTNVISLINLRVAFHAINARRLPLAPLVYTLVRPPPLPPDPVALEGQLVAPEITAAHIAWIKGSKEIAGLMLMTMEPEIKQNLENLHAYEMLQELKTRFAQQAEQELLQTVREFHSCKQEEGQSVSSYNYNMHGMGKTINELHAMLKLYEQTLPQNNAPSLHAIRAGHWKRNCPQYLAELLKKQNTASGASGSGIFTIELDTFFNRLWIYDTGCGTHICNTTQGLRASRKLKPMALSLYVGNGQRETVEGIGVFHLCLPSGLEIVLNNFHYAPYRILLGEYMSQEFLDHLKDHGIIAHRTPLYTPQHNGVSERRNRTLLYMVRSMMSQTTIPKSFWDYALETATRILNMVPTKKVENTSYEVWHGQAPKLSYLKVWGCEALVKRDTLTKLDKLEPRSIKCIFIGYPKETMGYSFYYPPENKVLVAQNAEFLKNSLITQEASGSLEDLEIIQEEDTHPSIDTSLHHEEDDL
ncbi:zinc finger, CCHC-type containing protein [Tanacetum coccineum]